MNEDAKFLRELADDPDTFCESWKESELLRIKQRLHAIADNLDLYESKEYSRSINGDTD